MLLSHAGQTSIPCATLSVDDFGTLVQVGTTNIFAACSVFTDGEAVEVSHETMMHVTRDAC